MGFIARKISSLRRWMLVDPKKRLPFTDAPLRTPGEHLQDKCDEILTEISLLASFPVLYACCCLWNLITVAWTSWRANWPTIFLNELTTAASYLIIGAFLAFFWRKMITAKIGKYRNLRLGLLAERRIGQELDRCRYLDYSVFHDIEEKGERTFNIDHVLIGPGGVYVIETKGKSKPLDISDDVCKIAYDGRKLVFNNNWEDLDDLQQARQNSDYIESLLLKLLREKHGNATPQSREALSVVPILAYPGWTIDYSKADGAKLRVVNEKTLVNFIKKAPERLQKDQYVELRDLLGQHLRDKQLSIIAI